MTNNLIVHKPDWLLIANAIFGFGNFYMWGAFGDRWAAVIGIGNLIGVLYIAYRGRL